MCVGACVCVCVCVCMRVQKVTTSVASNNNTHTTEYLEMVLSWVSLNCVLCTCLDTLHTQLHKISPSLVPC